MRADGLRGLDKLQSLERVYAVDGVRIYRVDLAAVPSEVTHRRRVRSPTIEAPGGYHLCATSITTREPSPGPSNVNTRKGNRARTPKPIVVYPSKLPPEAT